MLKPVKWEIKTEKINDNTYNLVCSKPTFLRAGPCTHNIRATKDRYLRRSPTKKRVGSNCWASQQKKDIKRRTRSLFDNVNVVKFLDKEAFIIKQKVEVVDASKPVSGYLTFMTCDNNRCLPPEDVDFSLTFDKATTGAAKADEKTAVVAAEENKPVIAASDTTKKIQQWPQPPVRLR